MSSSPDISLLEPEDQLIPQTCGTVVKYVGEGMANVVFSLPKAIRPMRGKLIRVPKEATGDYREIHKYWREQIYPLFRPRDLVPQFLVRLGVGEEYGDALVAALRAELDRADKAGERKDKFKGVKLKENLQDAFLIRDMRPRDASEYTFEFKPKWLDQSPTAPKDATRCRNCAREALRNNDKGTTDPIRCTLHYLTVQDYPGVLGAGTKEELNVDHWLRNNELMDRLRDAQMSHAALAGPRGVLSPESPGELALAMTLRDCTCFVRVSRAFAADSADEIEARLGDLDLKDWAAKMDYWRDMELRLIEEGYYHGLEKPRQQANCMLKLY